MELLLVIPINMIVLLAVVQFALFSSNFQQVVLACRAGAILAAESSSLPSDGNPVPPDITDLVIRQLSSSGIDPCAVILEHRVDGPAFTEQTLRTDFTPDCATCTEPLSDIPVNSVRLTICVPLTELMPNCMACFGLNIANGTTECSTTFGYEL